jgi:hypothetical protein
MRPTRRWPTPPRPPRRASSPSTTTSCSRTPTRARVLNGHGPGLPSPRGNAIGTLLAFIAPDSAERRVEFVPTR